ncbi:lipoprotein [Streptococcus anginosus]|uniref:lipoprotein n=1 Tax=Streptococcus anginosus TaxID=1328 RepID=UPI0030821B69
MRKSVVLLGASLLLLTACGQKSGQNQSGDSKTGSSVVKKGFCCDQVFSTKTDCLRD